MRIDATLASSIEIPRAEGTVNSGITSQATGILSLENVLPVINMSLSSENIDTEISNVGSISIAGANIPLGGLILILKKMYKSQNSSKYITGSLQKYNSDICLIGMMEGRKQYSWELSNKKIKSNGEDKIRDLVKDLTFWIIHDLSMERSKSSKDVDSLQAKTWEGFKHCTEAIDYYLRYINSGKIEHLENARKNCIEGLEIEKAYSLLFKLFFSVGVEYSRNKDYYFSEDVFNRCIKLRPKEEKVYNTLSNVLINLGRNEEALEAADKAIEELKTDLDRVWLIKSYVLANVGLNKQAWEALHQCIKLRPKEEKLYNTLRVFLTNLGRNEEVLVAADKAIEYSEATNIAIEELIIDLDKVWLNKSFALFALINLGHNKEALNVSAKAIEELKTDHYYAWVNKSLAFANLGCYEKALKATDKAIELNPDFSLTWSNKSFFLANLDRNDEALEAANKATELKPDFATAWVNKSFTLVKLDLYKEALIAVVEAINIDPSISVAWLNKSYVLANLGRNEEALEAACEAIKIDPSLYRAWVNKSYVLANLGRNEEALEAACEAIKIDPSLYSAWVNKSSVLSKLGRNEEALEAACEAIKIDPSLYSAWVNKSSVLSKLGHYEEALEAA
ncbi:MAG: tetratricopeptide repeat protein, partial [Methanosarcina sp.]|uniref:tetratricopeptide repeat protein n=1 Tax=Methanosarcina sp. TaxID=2213 RepID=UPI00261ACF98